MADQIPQPYQDFTNDFPSVARAYERFGSATHRAGPLDERTRRLVKLAIAVGGRLEGAVRAHARRADEIGVTAGEMDHVVLLAATTVGLPSAVSARTWIRDELRGNAPKPQPAAKAKAPAKAAVGKTPAPRRGTAAARRRTPTRPSRGPAGRARRG